MLAQAPFLTARALIQSDHSHGLPAALFPTSSEIEACLRAGCRALPLLSAHLTGRPLVSTTA
jgi:hypothetical protein